MFTLSEFRSIPAHLATKTQLRRAHLVPTGDPVAVYVYRSPAGGWARAPLYQRDRARDAREAHAARKRRMAAIHGQLTLF